jgi:tRNA1Val (adenine37-N6)-methyltransferase
VIKETMFQFKQFTIHQDQCAMKVTTDGCLFGAMVANEYKGAKEVLDIGTGTGLLSLMLAQTSNAIITAIEIDEATCQQAQENFNASPWATRLTAIRTDAKTFAPATQYDLIISNPPFFQNDLISPDEKKNAAKHDSTLTLHELIHITDNLLTADGYFAVLLPYHRVDEFINMAKDAGLYLHKKIIAKQTAAHHFFRGILFFSKKENAVEGVEIVIKQESGNYSNDFIGFLKDYYLYL